MDFDSSIYEAVKMIIDEWYPHGLVSCCCASVHEFGAEAAMIAVRIEHERSANFGCYKRCI